MEIDPDLCYLPDPNIEDDDDLVNTLLRRGFITGAPVDEIRSPRKTKNVPMAPSPYKAAVEANVEKARRKRQREYAAREAIRNQGLEPHPFPHRLPNPVLVRFMGGPWDGSDAKLSFLPHINREVMAYENGRYVWRGGVAADGRYAFGWEIDDSLG